VQTDLSYPSGHATYGYVMALLLADMVPERRGALLTRGDEFAQQRMVCGVHFPSDLVAGRAGAEWLIGKLRENAQYQREHAGAARELRAALGLRPLQREPRAAEAGAGSGRRATQHGHAFAVERPVLNAALHAQSIRLVRSRKSASRPRGSSRPAARACERPS
jgi:hypothetical protein